MSKLSAPHLALSIVIVLLTGTGTLALSSADFFNERHGSTGPTSGWPIFEEFANNDLQDEPEGSPAGQNADSSGPSDLQTGEDFGGGTYNAKKAWKVIDRSRQVTASEVDRKLLFTSWPKYPGQRTVSCTFPENMLLE